MERQLGIIGLGAMGENLARNALRNGAHTVVYNRTTEKMEHFMEQFASEGNCTGAKTIEELIGSLQRPRPILLMVKAGKAVDAVIEQLLPHLEEGDILIDGGNSHYPDTARRTADLKTKGIQFVGLGVSGGEEGALNGPSMMPGGSKEGYVAVEPLLTAMSADDGMGGKCITWLGDGGAGHFVKMVHNGIEYGMMQALAESYQLLKDVGGMDHAKLHEVFAGWKDAETLGSFLVEITADIFQLQDPSTGKDLLDVIVDKAGQKGTGKWTTDAALELGVAVPSITAAVDARIISAGKEHREERSKNTSVALLEDASDTERLVERVRSGLELSFVTCYIQGFTLLFEASKEHNWNLPFAEIARIWMGGCIIRSKLLKHLHSMYKGEESGRTYLHDLFEGERQIDWRSIVATGAKRGVPLPVMSSALQYFDAYRTARLPQNLIQAQRDYFGAHGFERFDKEGAWHIERAAESQ